MTYLKAQDFLNSFINYERLQFYPYKSSFRLNRVEKLLQLFGNPHQALRAIHIAGTKGKGSTCTFAAHILQAAGFKVGLYTSPHLVDIRERIRILQIDKEEIISKKDFASLIERIKPYAEKLRNTKLGKLSYFEVLTTLAFLYFKEKKVDFVVLETGIGGRLDATNVVRPLVCAITPISYEHTQVLGARLKDIAQEKAGIIKFKMQNEKCKVQSAKSQIVITAPQNATALKVIKRRAKQCKANLFEIGKDIQIQKKSFGINGQIFGVRGIFSEYHGLKIKLLGEHQILNATLAVACVESLRLHSVNISQRTIRKGLGKTRWPGRLQIISKRPRIVLDAAHNQASACALKDAVAKFFKFHKLILVLGVSKGKDVQGILRELIPLASNVILTKTENPRAMTPEIIKTFIKANERPIVLTSNPAQALKIARESTTPKDLILVVGSLFLVGEVLRNTKQWKICC